MRRKYNFTLQFLLGPPSRACVPLCSVCTMFGLNIWRHICQRKNLRTGVRFLRKTITKLISQLSKKWFPQIHLNIVPRRCRSPPSHLRASIWLRRGNFACSFCRFWNFISLCEKELETGTIIVTCSGQINNRIICSMFEFTWRSSHDPTLFNGAKKKCGTHEKWPSKSSSTSLLVHNNITIELPAIKYHRSRTGKNKKKKIFRWKVFPTPNFVEFTERH